MSLIYFVQNYYLFSNSRTTVLMALPSARPANCLVATPITLPMSCGHAAPVWAIIYSKAVRAYAFIVSNQQGIENKALLDVGQAGLQFLLYKHLLCDGAGGSAEAEYEPSFCSRSHE